MAQSKNKERRKERKKIVKRACSLKGAHTRTVSFEWPLHVLFYNLMTEGLKEKKCTYMCVYVLDYIFLHLNSRKERKKLSGQRHNL